MQLPVADSIRVQRLCRELKPLVAIHGAESVILGILRPWMTANAPQLESQMPPQLEEEMVVKAFVDWLSNMDILTGAYWISSGYSLLIDKERRKKQAMYFTSPHLAKRLLDNAGDSLLKGPIVDPACGGAAFLAPAALRVAEALQKRGQSSKEILLYIERSVHGVDTDPFLCFLSKTFLRIVLAPHIATARYEPHFQISVGDGLSCDCLDSDFYELVLCNPPYRKMTRAETEPYIDGFGALMRGQPNLYMLFIARAMGLLRERGTAVFLTPMSFLSGKSFSALRNRMTLTGRVSRLDLIHDKTGIFVGAEQDTAITLWKKRPIKSTGTNIYVLTPDKGWMWTGRPILSSSDLPWPLPRQTEDVTLLRLFEQKLHTLATYGYVPKTGFIVMHRHDLPLFMRRKDAKRPGHLMPLIWQSDISASKPLALKGKRKALHRYIDIGRLDALGAIRRPAVAVQRVTSAEQPRRLVCAPVPESAYQEFGGVVGENHVCFIEQFGETALVDTDLLCAILTTRTVDRLFRCVSGATNVSSYELTALPMPNPVLLKRALSRGINIEDSVRVAYGISPMAKRSSDRSQLETCNA
jgi:adenine-specific DNA-methyltransferase